MFLMWSQVSVCCNKTISDVAGEEPFHWRRREVLKCVGATVGLVRIILLQAFYKFSCSLFLFSVLFIFS